MAALKLILVSPDAAVRDAFGHAFAGLPEVGITAGRFEDLPAFDCVVSAANSFGRMDGGVGAAIVRFFGPALMGRVQQHVLDEYLGQQPVGTSFVVETGHPDHPFVAHSPTTRGPTDVADPDNVYRAMWATLLAVRHHNRRATRPIRVLACPGLGTGAGRVPFPTAAAQMALAYRNFLDPPRWLDWEFADRRQEQVNERMAAAGRRVRRPPDPIGTDRAIGEGDPFRIVAHSSWPLLWTIRACLRKVQKDYTDRLDPAAKDYIGAADDAAGRVQALIRALVTYSGVRNSRPQPLLTRSLPSWCGEAVATAVACLAAGIEESKATVTWDDDLPIVRADPDLLAQLFRHLIGNALIFRAGGRPPAIHVSAVRRGGDWEIGVKDNGIGIEPQSLERIFDLEVRVPSPISQPAPRWARSEFPRRGIGLAQCRAIVESYGGRIWASSDGPGTGTTISLTLSAAE